MLDCFVGYCTFIYEGPSNQTVNEGDTLALECHTTSYVRWKHNSRWIRIGGRYRMPHENDPVIDYKEYRKLYIDHVTYEDSGFYRCVTYFLLESSKSAYISVNGMFDLIISLFFL